MAWLGCYFNINKLFVKSIGTTLGTFISNIIILVFLSSYIFVFIDDKESSKIESKLSSINFSII